MAKKKLIEVALPLEAINAQSAREKSIRHGHPSTLHLWWARRPLATARAVLFAQLVDDPSERADEFRSEAADAGLSDVDAYVAARVDAERHRLFDLITRMVDWDNLGDEELFEQVRAEIRRSTDGNPPAILDPFAGGGTIPLEAQRLGLEAHASDLNPVAVLINKALIEIPPKFAGRAPVFPDAEGTRNSWPKATGLAEDVRRYGEWMRDEAERRIGHLYPKATLPDGTTASVIAWIWARTARCENPACEASIPLINSLQLSSKRDRERYLYPVVVKGEVEFEIRLGKSPIASNKAGGKGGGFTCWVCHAVLGPLALHAQLDRVDKPTPRLLAVVAAGQRGRMYVSPTARDVEAALVPKPDSATLSVVAQPSRGTFGGNAQGRRWGFANFDDYFTSRQLTALAVFSDLVDAAREKVMQDSPFRPGTDEASLEDGGDGRAAYADAVATYLALGVSRSADIGNSLATWSNSRDQTRNLFSRQAISMAWDYVEVSPFARASGDPVVALSSIADVIDRLPARGAGDAHQADASKRSYVSFTISTDPPYYDNIVYSDLSDFFYVWLRRSLKSVHAKLFSTMLVPKSEELVANRYRQGGDIEAQEFFESGFRKVFAEARRVATDEIPITVYYAFKQAELEAEGIASTGWETLLSGMVTEGWMVTATWPVRSERAGRMISIGTNALASSIVLALRPRPVDAPITDRRGFLAELKATLPSALRNLQQGSVAPVDMAQAAIGPGMATFSKFARVVEPSGEPMSVRDALRAINGVLAEVLSQQEGDFDDDTRWCVTWFETHGFEVSQYGGAETLASAKNASVAGLARSGVISSGGGRVKLFTPDELPAGYDPRADDRISLWEVVLHMARALSDSGLDAAGRILAGAEERGIDMTAAHELAYLLYAISEKRGLTQAGILFNTLGSSWPEVRAAAASTSDRSVVSAAPTLDFDNLEA